MTAATLTLTDFLLARIAEDEAVAQRAGSFTPWSETFQNDNYGHLTIQPERVLAECEAKRRIVGEWQTFSKVAADRDEQPLPQALTSAGIVVGLERAVRALAAVYADHPDYRDEWRP